MHVLDTCLVVLQRICTYYGYNYISLCWKWIMIDIELCWKWIMIDIELCWKWIMIDIELCWKWIMIDIELCWKWIMIDIELCWKWIMITVNLNWTLFFADRVYLFFALGSCEICIFVVILFRYFSVWKALLKRRKKNCQQMSHVCMWLHPNAYLHPTRYFRLLKLSWSMHNNGEFEETVFISVINTDKKHIWL